MVHRVALELLLADAYPVHDLHQLILDQQLLFLGHLHHDLLVFLVVVRGQGSSSLGDVLLLLSSELLLSVE